MHIFLRRLEKVSGSDKITYHSLCDHVNQGDGHLIAFRKKLQHMGTNGGIWYCHCWLSVGHLLKKAYFDTVVSSYKNINRIRFEPTTSASFLGSTLSYLSKWEFSEKREPCCSNHTQSILEF
jgi:hypothetical protein